MKLPLAIAAATVLCAATAHAETIDDVLARMDASAKQFRSYSAAVKVVRYGSVLESYDDSSGSMRLRRVKDKIVGILDTTEGPDHTILHFDGPIAQRYLPKAKTVEQYNIKQYASVLDGMVMLGFAITANEIKRDYTVKLVGPETISGVQTSHIVLTPKSAEALKYAKTIDLWIDAMGHAIRQKGTTPENNYRQATFSNLQVNPSLPDSEFELQVPKDVKVVKEN